MSVRRSPTLATAVLLLTLVACTPAGEGSPPTPGRSTGGSAGPSSTPSPPVTSTPTATPTPTSSTLTPTPRPTTTPRTAPTAGPVRFDPDAALADIRRLATGIGPRLATSQAFAEAADLVDDRFTKLGYRVRRTEVRVPAGDSWGVPVKAGTSQNLIAEPAGFDQRQPHIVIGAHLDTVAVAPGAEDNASGVSVLLELARMAAAKPPGTPVQFIAFGAEEPRGPADDEHHFGSQQHVANLSKVERNAVVAMVALDRVGVRSSAVPVCRSPIGGRNLRSDLRVAARTVDIPTRACELTTSDHWSYAKAGMPAARLGSVDYDEYHSRRDTFRVVDRRQLDRVGRVMWSWLNRG